MQNEINFFRQNQVVLEQEIKTLISDNQKLSQQVGMLVKENLQSAKQNDNNNEIAELQRQVSSITKERDSLHVLWQTSQRTIEALEAELKTYQSYSNIGIQGNNRDNYDLELKLETSLTDYVELEKNHKDLLLKYNSLDNDVKFKEKEINSYKERGKEIEDKLKVLEQSLEEFKINFTAEKKSNKDLKSQLASLQKELVERVKKETEAKAKVAEALHLFDTVTAQKNQAFKKISLMNEELAQLKKDLISVDSRADSKYREELDAVKDKYNEKVADMLEHISHLDAELVEKGLLLERQIRENKILQTSNEEYLKEQNEHLKALDPKLALAKGKLEVMFQELVSSERRNIQLVCEKQCLAADLHRVQDMHAREIKRRDWEEQLLKTQCEELKLQVEHLQKSLDETHGMINKLQNMLSSRTELNQKMVSTKEEELTELNKHLNNQMELSKKWKESYVDMTEKLKKQLQEMENENMALRQQLKYHSHKDNSCSS